MEGHRLGGCASSEAHSGWNAPSHSNVDLNCRCKHQISKTRMRMFISPRSQLPAKTFFHACNARPRRGHLKGKEKWLLSLLACAFTAGGMMKKGRIAGFFSSFSSLPGREEKRGKATQTRRKKVIAKADSRNLASAPSSLNNGQSIGEKERGRRKPRLPVRYVGL